MNLPAIATDNITEILQKIFEFTQARQKVLIQNINGMHNGDFAPKDLAVEEFSRLISVAVEEHSSSQRLVFIDGENIKFGAGGSFDRTSPGSTRISSRRRSPRPRRTTRQHARIS